MQMYVCWVKANFEDITVLLVYFIQVEMYKLSVGTANKRDYLIFYYIDFLIDKNSLIRLHNEMPIIFVQDTCEVLL